MKTRSIFLLLFVVLTCGQMINAKAQMRINPEELVLREKQNLYSKLNDLTEDQTFIIDGIYDELVVSMKELRNEVRKSGDRSQMREKVMKLFEEKDGLMKDVLNESQFNVYTEMVSKQREERKKRMQTRNKNMQP
ncbi:hypothetical protein [Aureibacter tunicatorum]|uniref:LTXXQ motif family protein n=1 Tax=Aureibacter tunicatorum TaxID=866807 RepID=A0AAE4BRM6_9BACT|nr:hypothetical protein [Aureibacter tunicatorum]MDR6238841.1 hypothetical protein [Aureibacter tunicatorum]BDD05232.1 hypothetical protein AUTU_27150 [Aureibacter tunicatorum]